MKKSTLFLLLVFIISIALRLYYVSGFHFAFTIDQARDMLELRKIVVGHDPVFVGPITSLNGIFLGPFWFYLNVLPFIFGGGDPVALAFFQVILIHFAIAVFWLYFRIKDNQLAFWGTLLLLVSPRLFEAGTYSFNANTTPLFVIFSLLVLDSVLRSPGQKKILFLGLLSGLTLQLEAAFGILIFPLCLLWLIYRRLSLRPLLLGFALTLLPQVLFELKHKFAMTKIFLSEFSGGTTILGERLSLMTKFSDRAGHYLGSLWGSFPFPPQIALLLPLAIVFIYFLFREKKLGKHLFTFFLINLSLLVLSFVLYFLYPNRLKDWWSINFVIPYIFIGGIALSRLPQKILTLLILIFALPFFISKYDYRKNERSTDRALLLNQIEVIDRIYADASGDGFSVYVFTPAVYDYPYQYLFWWYGQKKYGYLPEKLSYQDNVPAYVENNEFYWQNTKPGKIKYLIVETGARWRERELAWRGNFSSLCSEKKETMTGEIIIEKLNSCSP